MRKFAKIALSLAVVVMFVAAFAVTADAQTFTFTRDLTVGSQGADVSALQATLISQGHLQIAAPTGYFGELTRAAVARWQAAVGITPAAGYFGPVSRARIAAMGGTTGGTTTTPGCPAGAMFNFMTGAPCTGTTGTTTGNNNGGITTNGQEGSIDDFDILGNPSGEDVDEGQEDVEIMGFEFTAEDSDLEVDRLDVLFQADPAGDESDEPWDYMDSVSLWRDGEMVAEEDAGSEDDWSDSSEDLGSGEDTYRMRFANIGEIVEEGEEVEFIIAVTAKDNLDDDDTPVDFLVAIDDDGLRAVDGAGIDQYEGDASDEVELTFDEGDEGEIDLSSDDDDNEDRIVSVEENADTNDVEILRFMIESDSSDNMLEEFAVRLATTTDADSATTSLVDVIKSLRVTIDGEEVGDERIPSNASGTVTVEFDDIDDEEVEIAEDEEVEVIVYADINEQEDNFTEGYQFTASVVGADLVFEDAQGDNQSPDDTITGGDIELRTESITVELVSADETRSFTAEDTGEKLLRTTKMYTSINLSRTL
jgi:hypothetical protein